MSDKEEHVDFLLGCVARKLAKDSEDCLHHETSFNPSGGFECWNHYVLEVLRNPKSPKESVLRLHLIDVLEVAIENNFRAFQKAKKTSARSLPGDILGLGELINLNAIFRVIFELASVNPVRAMPHKIRFLNLIKVGYNLTITDFVNEHVIAKVMWVPKEWEDIW